MTYAQEKSSNKREADGQTFYDYEIFGPVRKPIAATMLFIHHRLQQEQLDTPALWRQMGNDK